MNISFKLYKYKPWLNVNEHKHAREIWGALPCFEGTLGALSNHKGLKTDR